jgi:hypothetical protein
MERELQAELALEHARRLELGRRVVDPDRPRATPRQPCRDICRPAPELDGILARKVVGEQPQVRLGDVPDAPVRLLCPVAPAAVDVLVREPVPRLAIGTYVLGEGFLAIGHDVDGTGDGMRRALAVPRDGPVCPPSPPS